MRFDGKGEGGVGEVMTSPPESYRNFAFETEIRIIKKVPFFLGSQ